MMFDLNKHGWVVLIALGMIIYLLLIQQKSENFACYPSTYQNYQMDLWHQHWIKQTEEISGLPEFKNIAEASYKLEDHDFYPVKTSNNKDKVIKLNLSNLS